MPRYTKEDLYTIARALNAIKENANPVTYHHCATKQLC